MFEHTGGFTILVADDDPDDRLVADELLGEISFIQNVQTLEDGQALLDYLRKHGRFSNQTDWQRPDLILLDLYMPGKGGLETLAELKADPDLARIPVVVLTGSKSNRDIERAFALGARSYMLKPLTRQRVAVEFQAPARS
ncbi:MAG: response regulator [Planctomycetota bacterium]